MTFDAAAFGQHVQAQMGGNAARAPGLAGSESKLAEGVGLELEPKAGASTQAKSRPCRDHEKTGGGKRTTLELWPIEPRLALALAITRKTLHLQAFPEVSVRGSKWDPMTPRRS